MRETKKATCSICGKKYDLCLSCRKELSARPWKEVADTESCYKLYMILLQFNNGYLSADEAKRQIEKVDYDPKALRDNVRENIDKILSTSKSGKKSTEKETQ